MHFSMKNLIYYSIGSMFAGVCVLRVLTQGLSHTMYSMAACASVWSANLLCRFQLLLSPLDIILYHLESACVRACVRACV